MDLIGQCRFGVHDLSRTDLSAKGRLPRFNMPLELGLFLGAMRFGGAGHTGKRCLILDRNRGRYRRYISDLAGQEIKSHSDNAGKAIGLVRKFLRAGSAESLPGGAAITSDYARFQTGLPKLTRAARLRPSEVTFADSTQFVADWMTAIHGLD